jgi:hypothetical protein
MGEIVDIDLEKCLIRPDKLTLFRPALLNSEAATVNIIVGVPKEGMADFHLMQMQTCTYSNAKAASNRYAISSEGSKLVLWITGRQQVPF